MLWRPLDDGSQLRLLEEADAGELHALIDANRTELSRWMPWAAGEGPVQTLAFIRQTRRQLADNDGLQTAIVRDGRIVGVVGFHAVDWEHRSTTIGYWLDAGHQGRGTMTRAVAVLVDHAFSVWELNRVEIRAAPENRRSRAIPERLGFSVEGTLRAAERIGERYQDHVVYALLASDWRAHRAPPLG